jgi:zinc protease
VVPAGTAPERVEQLIAAVREELARLLGDGIRPEELEEARRFLLGSDPFRRETARQLAVLQAQAALLGVSVDHADWLIRSVEALDRAAVESAVRRHLHPDRLVVTVGLPRSG